MDIPFFRSKGPVQPHERRGYRLLASFKQEYVPVDLRIGVRSGKSSSDKGKNDSEVDKLHFRRVVGRLGRGSEKDFL